MNEKKAEQVQHRIAPNGAQEVARELGASPKRRKLMNSLLGGALLYSLEPMMAVAKGSVPLDICDATDTVYMSFLRKLLAVATHDDAEDISFIEETLGVKFVLDEGAFPPNPANENRIGMKVNMHYFHFTSTECIPLDGRAQNFLGYSRPTSPSKNAKAKLSLRLMFSGSKFGRGVSPELVKKVFGPPHSMHHHIYSDPRGYTYSYEWNKRYLATAGFYFTPDRQLLTALNENDFATAFWLEFGPTRVT